MDDKEAKLLPSEGYRRLKPKKIIGTLEKLSLRVNRRFPEAGLYRVSVELIDIARRAHMHSEALAKPVIWVWAVNILLLGLIFIGMVGVFSAVHIPADGADFFELVQLIEAGINDVVLIGAGIFFLFTLESRVKRARAMRALHELRSIAHVIDMHQITKDPLLVLKHEEPSSPAPRRVLSPSQLSRYLDFCTDMLSLVGKISALYIQNFEDPVVQASVNEIESLTNAISQKIWQKLMIINNLEVARTPR